MHVVYIIYNIIYIIYNICVCLYTKCFITSSKYEHVAEYIAYISNTNEN